MKATDTQNERSVRNINVSAGGERGGGNKTASSKSVPRHRNQSSGEIDISIGPELSSKLSRTATPARREDNFHYLATFPPETKGNWNSITPRKGRESAVPRLRGKLFRGKTPGRS